MRKYRRSLSGNTPACAGKTAKLYMLKLIIWKHPRVRGEDHGETSGHKNHRETPPRARGRRKRARASLCGSRNTPACAGKTSSNNARCLIAEKHPRVRGEDCYPSQCFGLGGETPPRARGRRRLPGRSSPSARNTPACAGKTPEDTAPGDTRTKHPRVRGED